MEILCVGMYRACSTWQYEVASHLLERRGGVERLGYLTGDEYERQSGLPPTPTDRIVKSHEGHRSFAKALAEGRAVALYAHRDVRDVIFSLMHKRALSFETILVQGMIHQVLANDRFWARIPGLLVQRYDDLIADPIRGVAEIARYLGIKATPEDCRGIADEYSFESNRKRVEALGASLKSTVGDLADPSLAQVYDSKTLLHWNHLRTGQVGGWRSQATPRQLAALKQIAGDWLIAHGYEADTSWAGTDATASIRDRVRLAREIVRGKVACELRCLSLAHPELARFVKRLAAIPIEPEGARIAPPAGHEGRVDPAHGEGKPSKKPEPAKAPADRTDP